MTATPEPSRAPAPNATNVNVSPAPSGGPAASMQNASIWTASRVIALVFTVLEVLLLIRFTLKLLGANAEQGMVAMIYGATEPLAAPFRGIFAQPEGTAGVEIASVLAIVFFMLVAALILAIVRATTGRRGEPAP